MNHAIIRELQEEIGVEVINNLRYLTTLENIFSYQGETGHEIVMVYEGAFADESIYQQAVIDGVEDSGVEFKAVWKSLSDFQDGQTPLYPDGLLALLTDGA